MRANPAALRYWLLVGALACVVGAIVGHSVDRARAAEDAWGPTSTVLVVTRPVEPGQPLRGALRRQRWPAALVPTQVPTRVPDGATATTRLDPGAVLTRSDIRRDRTPTGPVRTIAVARGDRALPLDEGALVDVWATRDPSLVADGDPVTGRVATDARVVRVDHAIVVLGVPARSVAEVAEASATATLTLVGTT